MTQEHVSSQAQAGGTTLLESGRGSAQLFRLGPGVLFFVCKGSLSRAFYQPMVALAQQEVEQRGRLVMFVDGWELHSVDTGFREAWTAWFKLHRAHFHMRLLVRSALMDMAASMANLMTGIHVIKTYSNVARWERACTEDFPSFRANSRSLSERI
jgi:hypothetical protein